MNRIEDKLPEHLLDPVSLEPLQKAVSLIHCGHSVNLDTAVSLLARKAVCPICREEFTEWTNNHTLRQIVDEALMPSIKDVDQKAREILKLPQNSPAVSDANDFVSAAQAAIIQGDVERFQANMPLVQLDDPLFSSIPLLTCIASKNREMLDAMIEEGLDIYSQDPLGCTALHYAVERAIVQDDREIKHLIAAGIDVNRSNAEGNIPLHDAVQKGKSPEIVKQLVDAGSDVNKKNNCGRTPYDYAKENYQKASTPLTRLKYEEVLQIFKDSEKKSGCIIS